MQRYELLDLIGAGGMGTVYRAHDRLTGATVALKQVEKVRGVPIGLATESDLLQSIAHEFSVLAGLRHPHIISVLDYGFNAERQPFFTMELLDRAQTIAQAAQQQALPRQLRLLLQLLQALAYLHRRGILHRDLKPANVLVAANTVRVLDFGLAVIGGVGNDWVGTAGYIAPEIMFHQPHVVASDLYSVGVLATELFTGHQPFPRGDARALLYQDPDLTGLPDSRLQPILTRLLARDIADRYADANQVSADLAAAFQLTLAEEPTIRDSYLQAAPFIGRQAPLQTLTTALSAAMDGQGSAFLIGGESGIGKSRLLSELRIQALIEGALVALGQAVERREAPHSLWREPLAYLALYSPITDLEASILKNILPAIERLIGRSIPAAAALESQADAQRLAYTLVNLIQRAGQPIVLLLEDLHLATEESLAVLGILSRVVGQLPLLIVATYRSDEIAQLPAALNAMQPLQLERFAHREVAQLCAAMVGQASHNSDLIHRLQTESEGNVFFLIETLRALADHSGSLTQVTAEAAGALFPQGIAAIIQRRLDFIPAAAQPLLYLAAVAGRQLDLKLLLHAAAAVIDMERWLYVCAAASVLTVQNDQWAFSHDKLREGLLQRLSPDGRAHLHLRLARSIEALYPNDVRQAQRLADHWREGGDIDQALHYTLLAGDYLRSIGSYRELRSLIEAALALVRPTDSDDVRLRLYEFMGDAYRQSDPNQALLYYQEALTLCERYQLTAIRLRIWRSLAVIYRNQGAMAQSEQLTDQILILADEEHHVDMTLSGLMLKARFFIMRGEYEDAEAYYQSSLFLAQALQRPMEMTTLYMNLGAVACMRGQFDAGRAAFQQAETTAHAIGAVDIVVYSLLNQANLASDHADYATAATYFERCIPMIEALGEFTLLAGAYYDRGDLALILDELADARNWYQKGLHYAEKLQNDHKRCDCWHGLGKVSYLEREYAAAAQYIRESLRLADTLQLVPEQVANLSYLAKIDLHTGQRASAHAHLRRALTRAQTLDSSLPKLDVLITAVEALLFADDLINAAQLVGLIRHHPETPPRHQALLTAFEQQFLAELDTPLLETAYTTGAAQDLDAALVYLSNADWFSAAAAP